jgi:hypothetical protein
LKIEFWEKPKRRDNMAHWIEIDYDPDKVNISSWFKKDGGLDVNAMQEGTKKTVPNKATCSLQTLLRVLSGRKY